MIITAKFPSKCATCGGSINVGDKIEWSKGERTRHAKCQPAATPDADDLCAECQAPLHGKGTMRRDMSGLMGLVCRRCSRFSREDLSFC
jgi:DNA-directed RNA polymerase subunit RPC12/RpoP